MKSTDVRYVAYYEVDRWVAEAYFPGVEGWVHRGYGLTPEGAVELLVMTLRLDDESEAEK